MQTKKTVFEVIGMTCGHCEKTIERSVGAMKGVYSVSASSPKRQVIVTFDPARASEETIRETIGESGYKVVRTGTAEGKHPLAKVLPIYLAVLAVYFIVRYTIGFDFLNLIPTIDRTVSFVALFFTGVLTSVHCIAMCGGINLSQCVGTEGSTSSGTEPRFRRPILYNLGRVVSYTVIGGVVGGLGSVLSVSSALKGAIMLVAGVFMILMSLSMLGWLPYWLVPRLPAKWAMKSADAKQGKGPFVVGLLNGLMPCGPLQAMQLYALATGSVLLGALSMFLFAAGTVPLMLGAGMVVTSLKGRFSRSITRISAVLVMLIAAVMVVNATGFFGWSLLPAKVPTSTVEAQTVDANGYTKIGQYTVAKIVDGYQEVTVDVQSSAYPPILVQKGIPVRFNLRAAQKNLNGCNGAVQIPAFDLQKELKAGDNILEFVPETTGDIPFTCWMSMIRSKIVVVDDLAALVNVGATEDTLPQNVSGGTGGLTCCG